MNAKAVLMVGLFCLLLTLLMATVVTPTYAGLKGGGDAPKTGLGEVFKSRAATGEGPTSKQVALTIGATIVMIAVVKYA